MPLHNCTAEEQTGPGRGDHRVSLLKGSETREREGKAIHSYDSCASAVIVDHKEVREKAGDQCEGEKERKKTIMMLIL